MSKCSTTPIDRPKIAISKKSNQPLVLSISLPSISSREEKITFESSQTPFNFNVYSEAMIEKRKETRESEGKEIKEIHIPAT